MSGPSSIAIPLAALVLALAACSGNVEGGGTSTSANPSGGGTVGSGNPSGGGTVGSGNPSGGGMGGSGNPSGGGMGGSGNPSGGGGAGGSGNPSGGGGAGGMPTCAMYTGDGCTPGATKMVEFCIPGGGSSSAGSSSSGSMWQQCCWYEETCALVSPDGCATTWGDGGCETPLVLSFDGAPVELREDRAHGFALSAVRSTVTDWPTATTPWLALDRDGDGAIGDGSELFGSMTVLADGRRAPNGFAALRELDDNGDGRITAEDSGFARLLLWSDADGDRRSTADELAPLASRRILSIELDDGTNPRCDARGNCEVERAPFTWMDASGAVHTGEVIDVHLASRPGPHPRTRA